MRGFKPVFEDSAIVKKEFGGVPQKFSDDLFKEVTKGAGFIPRLQLQTSNSQSCKDGVFPTNHYALVNGKNMADVGLEVDVLVIAWRPKALDMSGDDVISVFDPANPEFKRIVEASGEANSNCMFGPEFLVYVPKAKEFATFFMGSKSARTESPNVKARLGGPATLKAQKIENKRYAWYAPACTACSTPIEMPNENETAEQVQRFLNPPEKEIETADASEQKSQSRAQ